MFGRKSKRARLVKRYEQLLQQSYELSTVNRLQSDQKLAEANELLDQIEALDAAEKENLKA